MWYSTLRLSLSKHPSCTQTNDPLPTATPGAVLVQLQRVAEANDLVKEAMAMFRGT